MYVGGKLLFADYIFNGYGNAKKDFLNQVDWLNFLILKDILKAASILKLALKSET